MKLYFLSCVCLLFSSCLKIDNAENLVGDVNLLSGQQAIRKWTFIGPFSNEIYHKDSYSKFDYIRFKFQGSFPGLNLKRQYFIKQEKDYLDLNKDLKTNKPSSAFAYCYINSVKEQDVAFLAGIDNNIRLWVNDKLSLDASSNNITKNEYSLKVHLKKGENLIVINTSSDKDFWGFHLDISSLKRARYYAFGQNFLSISDRYLLKKGDILEIRINKHDFYNTNKQVKIEISDVSSHNRKTYYYKNGYQWNLSLQRYKEGVYNCRVIMQTDTFCQKFVYGDYKKIFKKVSLSFPDSLTERESITLNTLIHRFKYLDQFGKRNTYDEVLERKMSAILFELGQLNNKLRNKESIFNTAGFHIRAFKSGIDHITDNYAIYIPENIPEGNKIPLIMIMPWVAKRFPFTESWHLAFIDRLEYLQMLAKKYGFGIMWQSARVYEQYNLNPIVSSTALEALKDLKQDYLIDNDKIYLYGTCSGGLQSLLMGNRYPSLFAAIGVEGPEISYMNCENGHCIYPNQWINNNSIINTAMNFNNVPLFIANSRNDWHGAKEPGLSRFINKVRSSGGNVKFDSIENAKRNFFIKMVNDNVVTDDIFRFFKDKKRHTPDTVKFSTFQLKYNSSYWLTINDIREDKIASITGYRKQNTIFINETNVSEFTVNLHDLNSINRNKIVKVYINGKLNYNAIPKGNSIKIGNPTYQGHRKNHHIEGPVNDFFSNEFLVIQKSRLSENKPLDILVENWNYNNFAKCLAKNEDVITEKDIKSDNLLLYNFNYNNPFLKELLKRLPIKLRPDGVMIGKKFIKGIDLSYLVVYPNPIYPSKYVLLAGSTSSSVPTAMLSDIALKGWNDIEIWDNVNHTIVYRGNFNRNWELEN